MTSIPLQTTDYAALPQKDLSPSDDDDINDNDPSPSSPHLIPSSPLRHRLSTLTSLAATPWILHLLLLLLNLLTFAYLTRTGPTEADCTTLLSTWSPAIDAGVVRYKTIPINGSRALRNQYQGPPGEEVDGAWVNVTTGVPRLALGREDLNRLRKSGGEVAKGEGGWEGQLEVYALLGCLDRLRKAAYGEREEQGGVEHCVEMLRVDLMCKSDVSVLTFGSGEGGEVDFTGVRKCRDFDEILGWSRFRGNGRFVDG